MAPRKPCAICGRPSLAAFTPFCSKRCADADLANWLGEKYAIPVAQQSSDEFDGEETEH